MQLESVVVTALGIRKNKDALTYSTQMVESDDEANDFNYFRGNVYTKSLSGSVSGIVIRGNQSLPGKIAKLL